MIITCLSIAGIVLFNAAWVRGGRCLSGMPFSWASASPQARVTRQPPALPRAFHRAVAAAGQGSPSRGRTLPEPSRLLSLHKDSPNSEMQKAFPALQGEVAREGEQSPPAPSLLL